MNDIAGAVPATLLLATCNLLNLARPGRRFYDNQEPFSPDEYTRKIDWLGTQIRRLGADVIAFQRRSGTRRHCAN